MVNTINMGSCCISCHSSNTIQPKSNAQKRYFNSTQSSLKYNISAPVIQLKPLACSRLYQKRCRASANSQETIAIPKEKTAERGEIQQYMVI